jgi:hypothetical protein
MEIDVSHLFTGHELTVGNQIRVTATNETPERSLTVTIAEPTDKEQQERLPPPLDGAAIPVYVWLFTSNHRLPPRLVPLPLHAKAESPTTRSKPPSEEQRAHHNAPLHYRFISSLLHR